MKFVVYDNACVRGLPFACDRELQLSSSLCFVLDRWHEQSRTACLDAWNAL